MKTLRLTMAQALVRYLGAQKVRTDKGTENLFGGVWAIFGHGNVAALGEALYAAPIHPYTEALLSAVPVPDPVVEATRRRIPLAGEIPSATLEHVGCHFRSRCAKAFDRCAVEAPALVERRTGHAAACHLPERA